VSKISEERREIREMTLETAVEELAKSRRNLFDLRLQQGRGEVKDVREFAKTKKRIARLMYKIHTEVHLAPENEAVESAADEEELVVTDEVAEDDGAETEQEEPETADGEAEEEEEH
jgi:ribosomal protein L29